MTGFLKCSYIRHIITKVSITRHLQVMESTIFVLLVVALMGLVCESIPNTDYPKGGDYNTYGGDTYHKSGYPTTGGNYYPGQNHHSSPNYPFPGYQQHGGSNYPLPGYPHNGGSNYPFPGYQQHGGSNYPLSGYPHGGANYPLSGYPHGGPSYPFPGNPHHGGDLNLPQGCNDIRCYVAACQVERCRNFPQAQCFGFCGGCVARFFVGGVNVTPFCGGSTLPGKPHKKY